MQQMEQQLHQQDYFEHNIDQQIQCGAADVLSAGQAQQPTVWSLM
jgi:hypothetical protein